MDNITDALAKPRSTYQSVGGVDTYLYMTIRYTETQTNKETYIHTYNQQHTMNNQQQNNKQSTIHKETNN